MRPREAGTTPNEASFSVSPESRNIFRQDKSLRTIPIPESESYREGGREGVNATILHVHVGRSLSLSLSLTIAAAICLAKESISEGLRVSEW